MSHYNHHREHQAIGDVAPIRRFELAETRRVEVVDGEVEIEPEPEERPRVVARHVDQAGRISILKHRYHVGRYLAGQQVSVESRDGLLHVTHNGVVIQSHGQKTLLDASRVRVCSDEVSLVHQSESSPDQQWGPPTLPPGRP